MTSRPNLTVADAVMLGVVVIWGGNNVIVKAALDELSPLAYVFARFLIVVLLLLAWLGPRRQVRLPDRADWPLFLATGASGFATYHLLYTVGLEQTSAFAMGLMIALTPVFSLLLTAVLGIERTRPVQWLGVGLAVLGVAIFVGDKLIAGLPAAGDWLGLLAAASFGVYALSTRSLVGRYDPAAIIFWAALIGLILVMPVTLPAVLAQDWRHLSAGGWASLLYASALSMLLAYVAWAWAIARRGVGRTVPYMFLVPIISGLAAAVWLGEEYGPLKIIGALIALGGTAVVRLLTGPTLVEESRPAARSGYSEGGSPIAAEGREAT